jgi:hypothetical protein
MKTIGGIKHKCSKCENEWIEETRTLENRLGKKVLYYPIDMENEEISLEMLEAIEWHAKIRANIVKAPIWKYAMRKLMDASNHVRLLIERATIPDGCQCPDCLKDGGHMSDCAVHNEPALPKGACDCGNIKCIKEGESKRTEIEVIKNAS